jgi:hypothetical protein
MAKLSFNKLGLKTKNEVKNVIFNEQNIEVKQYLPIREKMDLIAKVVELSFEDNGFINPAKVSVYTYLGVIEQYTNITFTETQKKDLLKMYDLLEENEIINLIINSIPEEEMNSLIDYIEEGINNLQEYKNSVMGVMENLVQGYGDLNFDIENLAQKITDPEAMSTLKQLANLTGLSE